MKTLVGFSRCTPTQDRAWNDVVVVVHVDFHQRSNALGGVECMQEQKGVLELAPPSLDEAVGKRDVHLGDHPLEERVSVQQMIYLAEVFGSAVSDDKDIGLRVILGNTRARFRKQPPCAC